MKVFPNQRFKGGGLNPASIDRIHQQFREHIPELVHAAHNMVILFDASWSFTSSVTRLLEIKRMPIGHKTSITVAKNVMRLNCELNNMANMPKRVAPQHCQSFVQHLADVIARAGLYQVCPIRLRSFNKASQSLPHTRRVWVMQIRLINEVLLSSYQEQPLLALAVLLLDLNFFHSLCDLQQFLRRPAISGAFLDPASNMNI
mmetsp:Transcript_33136/g.52723  ORF Transcript_33136/g.52723 Transcript_33136/m.52723 type:complete len:202 (-) Transcript_33136:227-832(-)